MTTKHIKRIGLNYSKIIILLVFVACGNNATSQKDKAKEPIGLNEVNEMRSKGVICNNKLYSKEHNLSEVDNCLSGIYAYASSIQIDDSGLLNSLNTDLDCTYILGHYVQYASFDKDLIHTCGNPPLNQ